MRFRKRSPTNASGIGAVRLIGSREPACVEIALADQVSRSIVFVGAQVVAAVDRRDRRAGGAEEAFFERLAEFSR